MFQQQTVQSANRSLVTLSRFHFERLARVGLEITAP
jgi:hypothetical protein